MITQSIEENTIRLGYVIQVSCVAFKEWRKIPNYMHYF